MVDIIKTLYFNFKLFLNKTEIKLPIFIGRNSNFISLKGKINTMNNLVSSVTKPIIGANCNICAHVLIENDVIIGDNVTIKSGVHLWEGLRIEDNIFIGPNVTFTNDKFPRSKHYPEQLPQTLVRKNASIGGRGSYLAQYYHRRSDDGGSRRRRYPLSTGSNRGDRQPRQNYWLCGSEQ